MGLLVGDLHGDLPKTIHCLELAGVVQRDDQGWPKWCGGNATVVQLGDVLDRGDCEIGEASVDSPYRSLNGSP